MKLFKIFRIATGLGILAGIILVYLDHPMIGFVVMVVSGFVWQFYSFVKTSRTIKFEMFNRKKF